MAKDIHEFRHKLMDKIMQADSRAAVVRLIDTAMKVFSEKKVHGHIVIRFIDKIVFDMEGLGLDKCGDKQRSNLEIALEKFLSIRRNMTETASL